VRRLLKWVGIVAGGLAVLLVVLVVLAARGVIGPGPASPEVIASFVDQDDTRLDRAWALPVAATFKRELFWQSNGSTCGPASLVNVYRSLGDDVADEDAILDGTGKCLLGFCALGLTLDELADVARASGGHEVTVLRGLGPEQFREHLLLANDPANRYIVNFTRHEIFGTGGGHHSPIGGYLEAEDLVLVLDVNGHYKPWLVDRARLFHAIDTWDGDEKRGLLRIR
jgi:hypothetical protein